MFKNIRYLLIIGLVLLTKFALAGPLDGKAHFVDAIGAEIAAPFDITGDIDVSSQSMIVDPWGPFFGFMVITDSVEVLLPGTYTRGAGTVTVLDGQVGAYININWGGTSGIPVFMVWNVSADGSSYSITDSDGDSIPGHAMIAGPFTGFTVYYEFIDISEPYVELSIDTHGTQHECVNGIAEVIMTANVQVFNGAVLDSVMWELNNVSLGSGLEITEELALGDYVVSATALTTTGQSAVESASFSVSDTMQPDVTVAFIDKFGNEVTSSQSGKVTVSIGVSDTCDANPVITSSTATPASMVSDGDRIKINKEKGIKLPVTAVEARVTAKDASGNFGSASATLSQE